MGETPPFAVRLPDEDRKWLQRRANGSGASGVIRELIRAERLREKMVIGGLLLWFATGIAVVAAWL